MTNPTIQENGLHRIGTGAMCNAPLQAAAEAYLKTGTEILQANSDTTSVLDLQVIPSESLAIETQGKADAWITMLDGFGGITSGIFGLISQGVGLFMSMKKHSENINRCNGTISTLERNMGAIKNLDNPAEEIGNEGQPMRNMADHQEYGQNSEGVKRLCRDASTADFTSEDENAGVSNNNIINNADDAAKEKLFQSCEKKLQEQNEIKNREIQAQQNIISSANMVSQSLGSIVQGIPKCISGLVFTPQKYDQESKKTVLSLIANQLLTMISLFNESAKSMKDQANASIANIQNFQDAAGRPA